MSPFRIFARLNSSRVESFFTTTRGATSGRSYVVKRLPQARHFLRLRMAFPSPIVRESMTLSSSTRQKGHCMRRYSLRSLLSGPPAPARDGFRNRGAPELGAKPRVSSREPPGLEPGAASDGFHEALVSAPQKLRGGL